MDLGNTLTWLLGLSLVWAGCDGGSGDTRRAPAASTPVSVAGSAATPVTPPFTPPSATASAEADPLAELGVTRSLPGGFVHYDDANLRDSQAPLVAVIVPASEAPRFYRQLSSGNASFWTPSATDVSKLDGARNQLERRQPGIAARSIDYRYQVLGIEVDGNRRLFVNAFCQAWEPWTSEPVAVDDGGDCYFTFEYQLDTGAILDLRVNGEG